MDFDIIMQTPVTVEMMFILLTSISSMMLILSFSTTIVIVIVSFLNERFYEFVIGDGFWSLFLFKLLIIFFYVSSLLAKHKFLDHFEYMTK